MGNRKVTDQDIQKIRELRVKGMTLRAIGREVGLSYESVRIFLSYDSFVEHDNQVALKLGFESLTAYREHLVKKEDLNHVQLIKST